MEESFIQVKVENEVCTTKGWIQKKNLGPIYNYVVKGIKRRRMLLTNATSHTFCL